MPINLQDHRPSTAAHGEHVHGSFFNDQSGGNRRKGQGCQRLHPQQKASAAVKRYEILPRPEKGAGWMLSCWLVLGGMVSDLF